MNTNGASNEALKEMMNMLLDTEEKTFLIIVAKKQTYLNCVQPLGELVCDELI